MKTLTRFRPLLSLLAIVGSLLVLLPMSSGPASAQVNSQQVLAVQFANALNGGESLFAISPTAALHSPEGEFTGDNALAEFREALSASFSNLTFTTDSVEQAADLTIISFTMTGVSTGAYHGLAANCGGVMVRGVAALRVNEPGVSSTSWTDGAMALDPEMGVEPGDGMVTEQWIGYNEASLASQVADPNIWGAYAAYDCGTTQEPEAAAEWSAVCPATPGCVEQEAARPPSFCPDSPECKIPY